jgi:hypothetical protein
MQKVSAIMRDDKKPLKDEELDKISGGYQFSKGPTNMPGRPPLKPSPEPPGWGPAPTGPVHPD